MKDLKKTFLGDRQRRYYDHLRLKTLKMMANKSHFRSLTNEAKYRGYDTKWLTLKRDFPLPKYRRTVLRSSCFKNVEDEIITTSPVFNQETQEFTAGFIPMEWGNLMDWSSECYLTTEQYSAQRKKDLENDEVK